MQGHQQRRNYHQHLTGFVVQAKKDTIKDNCKKLSSRLEKAVATQAPWAMPDAGLRAYLLEDKVAGSVLPLYSEFWREFDHGLKNLHKYVKCVSVSTF
jgi:hypothetical protein